MHLLEKTFRFFLNEISNYFNSKFFKQNLILIIAFGLPLGFVDLTISKLFENAGLLFHFGSSVVSFLWTFLFVTVIVFTIKRNKKHDMDLTNYITTNLIDIYWQTFKSFLLIFAGFLVLILPGIYLATRQQFVFLIAQDEDMVADPIKESFQLSENNFWPLLLILSVCMAGYVFVLSIFGFPFIISILLYPIFVTVHTLATVFLIYSTYCVLKQTNAET